MTRVSAVLLALLLSTSGCAPDMPGADPTARQNHRKHQKGKKLDLVAHYDEVGVKDLGRVKAFLINQGVEEEQMKGALTALLKLIYEIKGEGDAFEPNPKLLKYIENDVGLDAAQTQALIGMAHRLSKPQQKKATLEERYAELGVTDLTEIKARLMEIGVSEQHMSGTMRGLLRMLHSFNKQGASAELHPRLQQYFTEQLELTDDQIGQIEALALELSSVEK